MPSDPSGAQPKGTLVRSAADWFDDNIGMGGAFIHELAPAPTNTWFTVSLYNDATTGVALKVYGVTAFDEGGGGLLFAYIKGTQGTRLGPCSAIRPDLGAPFGQIYTQLQTGSALVDNPFAPGPSIAAVGAGGFDSATVLSPFPLFIIPAGYSLVGWCPASSQEGGGWFWYQQANE